jgi:hypothetical protein
MNRNPPSCPTDPIALRSRSARLQFHRASRHRDWILRRKSVSPFAYPLLFHSSMFINSESESKNYVYISNRPCPPPGSPIRTIILHEKSLRLKPHSARPRSNRAIEAGEPARRRRWFVNPSLSLPFTTTPQYKPYSHFRPISLPPPPSSTSQTLTSFPQFSVKKSSPKIPLLLNQNRKKKKKTHICFFYLPSLPLKSETKPPSPPELPFPPFIRRTNNSIPHSRSKIIQLYLKHTQLIQKAQIFPSHPIPSKQ